MVVSKKLKKEENTAIVESLIRKGGTSGADTPDTENTDEFKRVQLRIPITELKQMDQLVSKRPGNLARHTWIMEAIAEKLKKDGHHPEEG